MSRHEIIPGTKGVFLSDSQKVKDTGDAIATGDADGDKLKGDGKIDDNKAGGQTTTS